jgi:DNA-binding NtrC family response regulator
MMGPPRSSKIRSLAVTWHQQSPSQFSSSPSRVTPLTFSATMRILLVDDEPDFLALVNQWLRAQGHRSIAISDSREVLGLMEAEHFDVVCLDLLMPYIDGLQLIPKIHKRQPACHIVIMSGVADTRIVVEAVKEGVEDYLLKPIDFDKFEAILKRLGTAPRS